MSLFVPHTAETGHRLNMHFPEIPEDIQNGLTRAGHVAGRVGVTAGEIAAAALAVTYGPTLISNLHVEGWKLTHGITPFNLSQIQVQLVYIGEKVASCAQGMPLEDVEGLWPSVTGGLLGVEALHLMSGPVRRAAGYIGGRVGKIFSNDT